MDVTTRAPLSESRKHPICWRHPGERAASVQRRNGDNNLDGRGITEYPELGGHARSTDGTCTSLVPAHGGPSVCEPVGAAPRAPRAPQP